MDEATQQLALTLVVFGLPMSLACWVWLASFTGKLAHKADQPAWFAWLAPRLGATPERSNAYGVVAMIGLLVLFNAAPIGILLKQLWTPGSLLVDLAYFVVQGIIGGVSRTRHPARWARLASHLMPVSWGRPAATPRTA